MILWMLYSALVALVVAAAAHAAESLAKLAGYRVRWIWLGAILLTGFLSASAAVRELAPVNIPGASEPDATLGNATVVRVFSGPVGTQASAPAAVTPAEDRFASVRASLDAPWRLTAAVARTISPAANTYVASLAAAMTLALIVVLAAVAQRFRSARRAWPRRRMQGVDVRVAPRIGPLVMGIVRPEIVVPEWLLARDAAEQRIVLTHEVEHVRAGDPFLLGLAWSAVILAPWNPGLWYMMSRLRLAVELDCDARVLSRGTEPVSYGTLLIDVAQRASTLRPSALALAESSQLRRRILAMRRTVPRFAVLRAGGAGAFAIAASVVACTSRIPIHQDIPAVRAAAAVDTTAEAPRAARRLASSAVVEAPRPLPMPAPARDDEAAKLLRMLAARDTEPIPFARAMAETLTTAQRDRMLEKDAADRAQLQEDFPTVDVIRGWIRQFHPNVAAGDSRVNSVLIVIDAQKRYVTSMVDSSRSLGANTDSAVVGIGFVGVFGEMLLETAKSRLRAEVNRPVAILNGVRVANFDTVRADMVASSELIQGSKAVALYGPDAVNGAQVVTTHASAGENILMEFGIRRNADRLRKVGVDPDHVGDVMMLRTAPGVVGANRTYVTVLRLKDGGK